MAPTLLHAAAMRGFLLMLVLTGCGGDPDGPSNATPDASPDALPILPYRYYVVDGLTVPASSAEARQYGLDLDADTVVDNQLGNVIATLASMGVDANATVARSIDRGESILLARIGTTSFVEAPVATFQTYAGSDPSIPPCADANDTTCRRHLDGTASFTAAADPVGTPVVGTFTGGTFTGGSGHLVVRLALLGSAPIDLVLLGSRVELTMTTDTQVGAAKLAGAVSAADIDSKVIPAVRDNLMAGVTADCTALTSPPACGCATNSDGKTAIGLFDTSPQDCSISVEEVRDNSLIQALLAPDVMVEGTMALSLGVGATAVSAQFTAP